jgi:hypothetical protein
MGNDCFVPTHALTVSKNWVSSVRATEIDPLCLIHAKKVEKKFIEPVEEGSVLKLAKQAPQWSEIDSSLILELGWTAVLRTDAHKGTRTAHRSHTIKAFLLDVGIFDLTAQFFLRRMSDHTIPRDLIWQGKKAPKNRRFSPGIRKEKNERANEWRQSWDETCLQNSGPSGAKSLIKTTGRFITPFPPSDSKYHDQTTPKWRPWLKGEGDQMI